MVEWFRGDFGSKGAPEEAVRGGASAVFLTAEKEHRAHIAV